MPGRGGEGISPRGQSQIDGGGRRGGRRASSPARPAATAASLMGRPAAQYRRVRRSHSSSAPSRWDRKPGQDEASQ